MALLLTLSKTTAALLMLVTGFSRAFMVKLPSAHTSWHQDTYRQVAVDSDKMLVDEEPTVAMANRICPSVALVIPKGVRNMTARGSGFIVNGPAANKNTTYLVTAAHVAAPGYNVQVALGDQPDSPCSATLLARNLTLDLALLSFESSRLSQVPLPVSQTFPPVGASAYAFGFPATNLLRGPAMTSGIVCGISTGLGIPDLTTKYNETTYVLTDSGMSGGMSGGPLVDRTGSVIGVNALIRPDLRSLGNYAVSNKELQGFLDSAWQSKLETSGAKATSFRVVLFNDPMNKKERVSNVLQGVASLDSQTANNVMMKAHQTGRCTIKDGLERQSAESMCSIFQKEDVLVEVEQCEQ